MEKIEKYFKNLKKGNITHVSLNAGLLCNQSCNHCHLDAGHFRTEKMDAGLIEHIVKFLKMYLPDTLEITGGAPELNENLTGLIKIIRPIIKTITMRTNLTAMYSGNSLNTFLIEFLRSNEIGLIASLPCFNEENVDLQRGNGVFKKSISVLMELNKNGYGMHDRLPLFLVYNPLEENLPPGQKYLESVYRQELKNNYDVSFSGLIAMANVPVGRFKKKLEEKGKYQAYINMLKENFSIGNIGRLMCLGQVTIDWRARIYDCDFNLALDYPEGGISNLHSLQTDKIKGKKIFTGPHCLACTAGSGSSCHGSLQD